MKTFGWFLQVCGLVIVGAALGVGYVYEAVRLELAMLAGGGILFLIGRALFTR